MIREVHIPNTPTTVAGLWKEYERVLEGIPREGIQYKETKQAFYSGVYSLLASMFKFAELPEEQGMMILASMKKECEDEGRRRIEEYKRQGRL